MPYTNPEIIIPNKQSWQFKQKYEKFLRKYNTLDTFSKRIEVAIEDWKKEKQNGKTTVQIFEVAGISNHKRQALRFERTYDNFIVSLAGLLKSSEMPYDIPFNVTLTPEQNRAADYHLVKLAYMNLQIKKQLQ